MKKILFALTIFTALLGCKKDTYDPYSPGTSSNNSSSGNSSSGGCTCGAPTKTTGAPCQRAVVCGSGYCWQHD